MSSASAYKNIKRRMAGIKERRASKQTAEKELGAASSGLLKRKPAEKKDATPESLDAAIVAYIEALRGVEE